MVGLVINYHKNVKWFWCSSVNYPITLQKNRFEIPQQFPQPPNQETQSFDE
jgi:hypothetical protein